MSLNDGFETEDELEAIASDVISNAIKENETVTPPGEEIEEISQSLESMYSFIDRLKSEKLMSLQLATEADFISSGGVFSKINKNRFTSAPTNTMYKPSMEALMDSIKSAIGKLVEAFKKFLTWLMGKLGFNKDGNNDSPSLDDAKEYAENVTKEATFKTSDPRDEIKESVTAAVSESKEAKTKLDELLSPDGPVLHSIDAFVNEHGYFVSFVRDSKGHQVFDEFIRKFTADYVTDTGRLYTSALAELKELLQLSVKDSEDEKVLAYINSYRAAFEQPNTQTKTTPTIDLVKENKWITTIDNKTMGLKDAYKYTKNFFDEDHKAAAAGANFKLTDIFAVVDRFDCGRYITSLDKVISANTAKLLAELTTIVKQYEDVLKDPKVNTSEPNVAVVVKSMTSLISDCRENLTAFLKITKDISSILISYNKFVEMYYRITTRVYGDLMKNKELSDSDIAIIKRKFEESNKKLVKIKGEAAAYARKHKRSAEGI